MRSLAPLFVSVLLASACTEGSRLSVDVRSDWVPAEEFSLAEVTVSPIEGTAGSPQTFRFETLAGMSAVRGLRVANFADVGPGEYRVEVVLLDLSGAELDREDDAIRVAGDYSLVLVLDRACQSLVCEAGLECRRGACVDPAAGQDDDVCRLDSECDLPSSSCAEAVCVAGGCFYEMSVDACGAAEWCEPAMGCQPREGAPDAGPPDAGPPDAGPLDAGPSDAGPEVAPETPVLSTPSRGAHVTGDVGVSWHAPGVDQGDAVRFELQIAAASADGLAAGGVQLDFSDPLYADIMPSSGRQGGIIYGDGNLSEGQRYLWSVRACTPSRVCSAPAEPSWFVYAPDNDIDGDGVADLIVSAARSGTEGAIYVYPRSDVSGSATSFTINEPTLDPPISSANSSFATAFSVGDVSGDGMADLLVGAPTDERDGPGGFQGRAMLYFGQAGGPFGAPMVLPESSSGIGGQGQAVLLGPDLDRDGGYGDLAVTEATSGGGVVQLYSGHSGAPVAGPILQAPELGFGWSLAACDLTGDGWAELIVGAPFEEMTGGRVYIIEDPFSSAPKYTSVVGPAAPEAKFGSALHCAGDLDEDGYQDLLIGAHSADVDARMRAGRAYLLYGDERFDDGGQLAAPRMAELPHGAALSSAGSFGWAFDVVHEHPDDSPHIYVTGPGGDEVLRISTTLGSDEWRPQDVGGVWTLTSSLVLDAVNSASGGGFGSCVRAGGGEVFVGVHEAALSGAVERFSQSNFAASAGTSFGAPDTMFVGFGSVCR